MVKSINGYLHSILQPSTEVIGTISQESVVCVVELMDAALVPSLGKHDNRFQGQMISPSIAGRSESIDY